MPDTSRDVALQNIAAAIGGLRGLFLGLQTYATGTWTPALTFGGSAAGMTIVSSAGAYTQIGREFVCEFNLTLGAKGSSTGSALLTGFPAAANGSGIGAGGSVQNYTSMVSISGFPSLVIAQSASSASFQMPGTASSSTLTDGNFTNLTSMAGRFGFYV